MLAMGCGLAHGAHAARAKLIDTFANGGYAPYYGLATTKTALYGVTTAGNAQNDACGTVFQLARQSGQWQSTTLHSFSCGKGSGEPDPVTVDSATGDVWGSLISGSYGAVFRLTKPKSGNKWAYTTIYRFQGGTDGNLNSIDSPLLLQGGAAFGVAAATDAGGGVEFYSLTHNGSGWQKASLATIANVRASSLVGFDGNGAAYISANKTGGAGDVYQVAPQNGGGWTVTKIAHFNPTPTQGGIFSLVLDGAGNVFGLQNRRIRNAAFELTPPGNGGTEWTKSIIADPSKHGYGLTALALGVAGNLIGAIYGDQDLYGGAAVALTKPAKGSNSWTSTILWNFGAYGPDTNPLSINVGPYGLYYGTMNNTYDNGAVYELKP
jgi:hypothetical protein